ncbi:helix-turn-helix domain-containing protein [Flavobacterium sp.]|uniref:helix-turn-helix domain-containing protein n=1 Tax=Flavobacterium sp. TaxID=239 RepID=UPI00403459BB
MEQNIFDSGLKKIGLVAINGDSGGVLGTDSYSPYIKIVYLPGGYSLTVDFSSYRTTGPTLFFVSPNQVLNITGTGSAPGSMIFYNRDFYCIQIHDEEVACDGLLFNNIYNMPMTTLTPEEGSFIDYLYAQIGDEFIHRDSSHEEMIRTYLKQLFIRSVRLWKRQHLEQEAAGQSSDIESFRKFTQLVEAHYKEKHNVADYAALLSMAPKTITHRFKRLSLPQPNEVIKNRIVLEAKRLLAHTQMSSKEIAYELGYEDPAYFSRLFLLKAGETPSGFRAKFLS